MANMSEKVLWKIRFKLDSLTGIVYKVSQNKDVTGHHELVKWICSDKLFPKVIFEIQIFTFFQENVEVMDYIYNL